MVIVWILEGATILVGKFDKKGGNIMVVVQIL